MVKHTTNAGQLPKVRKKNMHQLSYISQSVILEEAVNPHIIRATMFVVSLAIVCFLFWASITKVSEVAKTAGEVVPSGYTQTIQHLEGGIISKIKVQEGELVEKGQILIVLQSIGAKEDLSGLKAKQLSLLFQAERLRAFINDTIPDFDKLSSKHISLKYEQMKVFESMVQAKDAARNVILTQISQKEDIVKILRERQASVKENLLLTKEEYLIKKKLTEQGHATKISFLEIKKQLNSLRSKSSEIAAQINQAKEAILEFESRLSSLEAKQRDGAYQRLNETEVEILQNAETIDKFRNRVSRLNIRASVNGIVKDLRVNTIGGVVVPGQTLLEVVPIEKELLVECRILPKDVGHVKLGQEVFIKVSSYDFARYGMVDGTLEYISPTTFVTEDGERYYLGRIKMSKNFVGSDPTRNIILPGMTVQADIITGEKTILSYLLKPIHTAMDSAFKDR